MNIKKEYEELRKIVGNLLDAPGKGGNISIKHDGMLFIKPSGQDMKNQHPISIMRDGHTVNKRKPSMEWKFHQEISSRFIVHYHPVYVLPYLCSDYSFSYGTVLDYITPGEPLASEIAKVKELDNIIFLKNHGVIIHSNSIEEIKQLYSKIKKDFFIEHKTAFTPDDIVDSSSSDLYLFRWYVEAIAMMKSLKLSALTNEEAEKLLNNNDEKYRQSLMEK